MIFFMIKDLFEQMEKSINNDENKLNVLLRFGHAENMYPFMTALGLFRDKMPLQSDNYQAHSTRNFKSGFLTPFSANVAFILHKCESNNELNDSIFDKFKINVLVNELPISKIKNAGELLCSKKNHHSDHKMCNYLDLRDQLNEYLNLDYEKVCKHNKQDSLEKGEL
jgi:hypothetical protein